MEMTPTQYANHLAQLAQEIEDEDPFDWSDLSVDKDQAYRLMAMSVVEMMLDKYGQPDMRDVILSTVIKLVVENFVLNLRLRDNKNGSKTV